MAKINSEESLETREQKYKATMWNRMFIPRDVITSRAYLDLNTSAGCQVYMLFRTKCRMEPAEGKRKRKDNWIIANNGEIQFSYKEAREKWGILESRFKRAIDDLVRVGLIDIAHTGCGLHKDVSLYAISERWRLFGTDDFISKARPKRKQAMGFTKGNTHGKNAGKKQNEHSSVTADQHSQINAVA
jgi:hypothetical protein